MERSTERLMKRLVERLRALVRLGIVRASTGA